MADIHSKSIIDWYDENAQKYSESIAQYIQEDLANSFIYLLDDKERVLDVGCAAGRDSEYFAEAGFDVVGIDASEGLLNIARRKCPEVTFKRADMLKLPFEDASFDGVWSSMSLVHMDTPRDAEKAIQEFYRVLARQGILFVAVKTKKGVETEVSKDSLAKDERFMRYYTQEYMENMLQSVGFTILKSVVRDDAAGRKDFQVLAIFARK